MLKGSIVPSGVKLRRLNMVKGIKAVNHSVSLRISEHPRVELLLLLLVLELGCLVIILRNLVWLVASLVASLVPSLVLTLVFLRNGLLKRLYRVQLLKV